MGKYSGLHPNDDAGHAMYEEQHRGHPDPDPYIPCHECGEKYSFEDYWAPRYVDPEDANPHEDTWLCDRCAEIQQRRESNRDLEAFAHD